MKTIEAANGMLSHNGGNGLDVESQKLLDSLPIEIPRSKVYLYDDFDKYRLADGFFGDVYKVVHRATKEIMVMKVNKEDSDEDTVLEEIFLLSRLSHENVLRFRGICVQGSSLHMLTEFINGGNLEDLLLNHDVHLEWSVRAFVSGDIANGMAYIHQQDLMHRDLATKNCLIRELNGCRYAVVADLGLSTQVPKPSDERLPVVGSPYNVAPELLRGEKYDQKADVFSYGIVLCEIIGRVPADPDELPRTNSFGLDVDKFQCMVGDCPSELLQVALCCCQIDPRTRPSFREAIKHFQSLLGKYPSRPRPVPDSGSPYIGARTERVSEAKNETAFEKDGRPMSPAMLTPNRYACEPSDTAAKPEKRRLSWIGGRYHFFHAKTDDLLETTPGKLKQFFHRVLRTQRHKQELHLNSGKEHKVKHRTKKRSVSELKAFTSLEEPLATGAAALKRASFSDMARCESSPRETSSFGSQLRVPSPLPGSLSSSESESASPRIAPRAGDAHSGAPVAVHIDGPLPSSNSEDEVADLVDGLRYLRRHSTPGHPEGEGEDGGHFVRQNRSASCRGSHAAPNCLSPASAIPGGTKSKGRKSPFAFFRRSGRHKFTE